MNSTLYSNSVTTDLNSINSGVYYWWPSTTNQPNSNTDPYGITIAFLGANTWKHQFGVTNNGRIFYRYKINTEDWANWKQLLSTEYFGYTESTSTAKTLSPNSVGYYTVNFSSIPIHCKIYSIARINASNPAVATTQAVFSTDTQVDLATINANASQTATNVSLTVGVLYGPK